MDIGQSSRSRYAFEKHFFNQQHVRLNFEYSLLDIFKKSWLIYLELDFKCFTVNQKNKHEIKWSVSLIVFE